MELKMEYATFCNICLKKGGLRKLEKSEHLLKILMKIIEYKIVIKTQVYLCLNCCKKLESYDHFKEMCLKNLIHFQVEYTELKKKLHSNNDPNVENKLKSFIESKVAGSTATIKAEYDNEQYKNRENSFENSYYDSALPIPIEHIKLEPYVEDIDVTESNTTNKLIELSKSTQSYKKSEEFHTSTEVRQQEEHVSSILHTILNKSTEPTTQEIGGIECNFCHKTFINSANLKVHMLIHTSKNPFMCTICNESFPKSSALKAHEVLHSGRKRYSCNVCNKTYAKLSTLRAHESVHTGEMPHVCNICNKAFSLPDRLKAHMVSHTDEKPYTCLVCNKHFKRLENLKGHERVHTGEKPYTCMVCNKSFRDSGNLRKHELVHTGEKPYTCKICKKAFRHINNLKAHERSHSGEKPHECPVCNERFTQLYSYRIHQLIHTGEKPHTCNVCKKAFRQLSTLREHERIHTGLKPYTCTICKKTFRQRSHLRLHKKKPCELFVSEEKITEESEKT